MEHGLREMINGFSLIRSEPDALTKQNKEKILTAFVFLIYRYTLLEKKGSLAVPQVEPLKVL